MKFSKIITALIASSSFLFPINANADGTFKPTKLALDFYEIGLRDTTTGNLLPIFKNDAGVNIDLVSGDGEEALAEGVSLSSSGVYDQMYVLTSNAPVVSGTDGNGCYIKAGNYTDNDASWAAATSNISEAGEATLKEMGFDGSNSNYGPSTPAVTTSFNGTKTTSLDLYLVNDVNTFPGTGGVFNRYLFVGNLTTSVDLTDVKDKVAWVNVDTTNSSVLTGSCTVYGWNNTKFGLSIQEL